MTDCLGENCCGESLCIDLNMSTWRDQVQRRIPIQDLVRLFRTRDREGFIYSTPRVVCVRAIRYLDRRVNIDHHRRII